MTGFHSFKSESHLSQQSEGAPVGDALNSPSSTAYCHPSSSGARYPSRVMSSLSRYSRSSSLTVGKEALMASGNCFDRLLKGDLHGPTLPQINEELHPDQKNNPISSVPS